MFKRLTRSRFNRVNVKVGSYVLLAVSDEDAFWNTYNEYNALSPDRRLRINNPMKPYNRQTGENCWIQRVKKPITRCFYQVIGLRDGIMVKSIQKGHPRANGDTSYGSYKCNIYLNNILDIASGRDEMIEKRNQLK